MAEVVETRRSLEQYIMVQFMLNRSRIKAARKDLLERWSKVMGVSRVETRVWCILSGYGDTLQLHSEEADLLFRPSELIAKPGVPWQRTGLFGIGDGSPHR